MNQWTEKEVMEHAKELKSPFDKIKQNGQGAIERLKELSRQRKRLGG